MKSSHEDVAGSRVTAASRRPGVITAALTLVGVNVSFMQTLIVPIQAELPRLIGTNKDDASWAVTATLLAAAIMTPIAGRLGDLFGKKRVMLWLFVVLVAGSAVCALAVGLPALIVGRALQGASIGVVPLGIAILRDLLPSDRLPGAVALVSATIGVGGATGPLLSAVLLDTIDWRAVFWLSATLGAISLATVAALVPSANAHTNGRIDLVGAALLAAGLGTSMLAVSKGNTWGWTHPATLLVGGIGVGVLLLWAGFELRARSPLVDLRVASRPAALFVNLASIALGFAMFTSNIAIPQQLQSPVAAGGIGVSATIASIAIMPAGLMILALSTTAGRLIRRHSARRIYAVGSGIMLISWVFIAFFSDEFWQFAVFSVVLGSGTCLCLAAAPLLVMRAAPIELTASANALNALARSVGTTLSGAVIGAILAASSAVVAGTASPVEPGFTFAYLAAGLAALLSMILGLFVPSDKTDGPD